MLLLILTAFLYSLPFVYSQHLWWLIFISPAVLFYLQTTNNYSFKHGFIWGFIALNIQLFGIVHALVTMAHGPLLLRLVPSTLIILYFSFFTGFWFWLNKITFSYASCISIKQLYVRTFISLTTFWVYICFMDFLCLIPLGTLEGCFILHPLLPISQKPQLLQLLKYTGKPLLTFLFLLAPTSLTLAIQKKTFSLCLLAFFMYIPWVISYMYNLPQKQRPTWLDSIAYMPAMFPDKKNLCTASSWELQRIIKQQPLAHIIIAPESACYADLTGTNIIEGWKKQTIGKKLHILFGTFSTKNSIHYNTLYWFYNGILQTTFEKRHAVPLTERLPSLFDNTCIHNLYFNAQPPLCASKNPRPCFSFLNTTDLIPYICSELFCNQYPDDHYTTKPIMAICNDSWFSFFYIKKLLYLAARMKAIQWQRPILYISYTYAVLFDSWGNEYCV